MLPIYWTTFSWEAFAALVTGILAVGGAVFIGLKQVGITRRQTDILDRQARLSEMSLREALFDRRMSVYEATLAFVRHVAVHADDPPREIASHFNDAYRAASFLFAPNVIEVLDEIWDRQGRYHMHRVMRGSGTSQERSDHVQLEHEQHKWFLEKLNTLASDFGEDMQFGSLRIS